MPDPECQTNTWGGFVAETPPFQRVPSDDMPGTSKYNKVLLVLPLYRSLRYLLYVTAVVLTTYIIDAVLRSTSSFAFVLVVSCLRYAF